MTSATSAHGRKPASGSIALDHLAVLGIYMFALSWPLDAFQRLLWPIHLYHIALVPAFLCAARDLKRNKRLRTPFELWWPCAAIFLAAVGMRLSGYTINVLEIGALCLSFICLSHGMRNRQMVLQALYLFLLSSTIAMAMNLAATFNIIFPTIFSVTTGWVMASPYTMQAGITAALIAIALIPALLIASKNKEYSAGRTRYILWIMLPVLLLLYGVVSPQVSIQTVLPWHAAFLMPAIIPCAILLWGVARIMAKLWVARYFLNAGVYNWLIAGLFLSVVILFWVAPEPAIGFVFILAAVAGYGQPSVLPIQKTRLIPLLGGIVLLLLVINIAFVLPGDPRNYERIAQIALKTKTSDHALAHLEFVKDIAPEESRADYYIARILLSKGLLADASEAFAQSLQPTTPWLLPSPDENLIDLFLNEMREKSSALPEDSRGLAYEHSLIAAGRDRHALSLLELRGKPDEAVTASSLPLASALAGLLQAPHLTETLATWNAGLLADIVKSSVPDAEIAAAPAEFPDSMLPFVAVASIAGTQDSIQVFTPLGTMGGIRLSAMHQPTIMDMPLAISPPEWKEWRRNDKGVWTLAFGKIAEIHILNSPEIFFSVYPSDHSEDTCSVVIFMPEKNIP